MDDYEKSYTGWNDARCYGVSHLVGLCVLRLVNIWDWAHKHGVSVAAISELQQMLGAHAAPQGATAQYGEAAVQSRVRLEGARKGVYLWRNNIGAGTMEDGSFIRWGLANESEQQNKRLKSADLIGLRATTITPSMVGTRIGQFVSRECKPSQWTFTNTPREQAQLHWATLINSLGGDAAFVTGEGTL